MGAGLEVSIRGTFLDPQKWTSPSLEESLKKSFLSLQDGSSTQGLSFQESEVCGFQKFSHYLFSFQIELLSWDFINVSQKLKEEGMKENKNNWRKESK